MFNSRFLSCIYAFASMMLALGIFTTLSKNVPNSKGTSCDLRYANWLDKRECLPGRKAKKFNNLNFLAFLGVYADIRHPEAANVFRASRNGNAAAKLSRRFPLAAKTLGYNPGFNAVRTLRVGRLGWVNGRVKIVVPSAAQLHGLRLIALISRSQRKVLHSLCSFFSFIIK